MHIKVVNSITHKPHANGSIQITVKSHEGFITLPTNENGDIEIDDSFIGLPLAAIGDYFSQPVIAKNGAILAISFNNSNSDVHTTLSRID